jgi:hypothetical protein
MHTSPALLRVASLMQSRAEQAEHAHTDLQHRFDEQERELTTARARIVELELLLAVVRGEQDEAESDSSRSDSAQPESHEGEDAQHPGGRPGGSSGGPCPRPPPATPRPGIMEVRRRLSQTLSANADLRTLVEELQLRVAVLERRCMELERQLQRTLILAEEGEPPASGQPWDADSATRVQERAAILMTELEQVRQERDEIAEQRDRLSARLTGQVLPSSGIATGPFVDYSAGRTALYPQIRSELLERDQFAQWEGEHRPRETDRRLDPTRSLDEQALVATITVRWQLMDHAPHTFRHRPRWVVEGVLLDPVSEQFLIRQSRERVAYRQRIMAAATAAVT